MTPLLWIALGFVVALVVFLMVTFFKKDTMSANQFKVLRLLSALCSGFAGAFFTGDALFRLEQQLSNGAKLGISGTAGFALFFVVWFTFGNWQAPQHPPPPPPLPPDRVTASFPEGLFTFEVAARTIAKRWGPVDFQGFQPEQLAIKMHATDLDEGNVEDALTKLWYAAYDGLPKYRVDLEGGIFCIRKLESSHAS